jgi:hypothetical protein
MCTYTIMAVQADPMDSPSNATFLFNGISSVWRSKYDRHRDSEVDQDNPRGITEGAKQIIWFDISMYNSIGGRAQN